MHNEKIIKNLYVLQIPEKDNTAWSLDWRSREN